jgi:hypothetical protein
MLHSLAVSMMNPLLTYGMVYPYLSLPIYNSLLLL